MITRLEPCVRYLINSKSKHPKIISNSSFYGFEVLLQVGPTKVQSKWDVKILNLLAAAARPLIQPIQSPHIVLVKDLQERYGSQGQIGKAAAAYTWYTHSAHWCRMILACAQFNKRKKNVHAHIQSVLQQLREKKIRLMTSQRSKCFSLG